MTKIIACIDGSIYSHSVADYAAWVASRLSASVELLQALSPRQASSSDLSGSITPDAQRQLLADLAALDVQRAQLIQQRARHVMDEAKARLLHAGIEDVTISLRNGDLLDTLQEREFGADIVILGKRGEAADFAKLHLGSNVERVIRASHTPTLVTARAFKPVKRVLIAFDGAPSSLKAVDYVVGSPLFVGFEIHIVMVAAADAAGQKRLDGAADRLRGSGLTVVARIETGLPEKIIAATVDREAIDLLIMGAYGHSRMRTLIIGSTTTEMVRSCKVPVLLLR